MRTTLRIARLDGFWHRAVRIAWATRFLVGTWYVLIFSVSLPSRRVVATNTSLSGAG